MAGVVKNLMVRAGADFSAITDQSRKAAKSVKGMESSVSKSCSAMQKALGGLKKAFTLSAIVYGVRRVYQAAQDAAEAYDQQAEAENRLARAMRNTMGTSNGEIQSILDLAAAQQKLGVVGDEVQLAAAQELSTYLSLSSSLQTLIPVMNDMAVQQYGYNVTAEQTTSITTMLGKVMNGQVNALSRYGYTFTEAEAAILRFGNEEQRAATLARVVEQSVGGMNRALAQTPTGRMKQLSNALGDIKEQFGQAVRTIGVLFIPLLNKVADILAAVATLANRVAQSFANVFGNGQSAGSEWKYLPGGDVAESEYDLADGAYEASDGMDEMTKSAKKAKEAVEDLQRADFDTLHVLAFRDEEKEEDEDDTGRSTAGSGTPAYTPPSIERGSFTESFERPEGIKWLEDLLQGIKNAWNEIKAFCDRVAGAAEALKERLKAFKDNILGYWGDLQQRLSNAFGFAAAAVAFGALIDKLIAIANAAAGAKAMLEAISLTGLLSSLGAATGAAEALSLALGAGGTAGLLGAFSAAAGAAEALSLALGAGGTAGLLGAFSGAAGASGLLVDTLGGTAGLLGAFGGASTGAGLLSTALGTGGLIASLASGTGAVGGFGTALTGTMVPALTAGTGATATAATGAAALIAPIAGVIAIIAALGIAIYECVKHWDEIKEVSSAAWDWIQEKWQGAGEWFNTIVWQPVSEWAAASWDNIQEKWQGAGEWFRSDVWDPITSSAAATWEHAQELAGASREWIEQRWNDTGDWFNTNVWTPISEWAAARWKDAETSVTDAWETTQQAWQGAGEWFRSDVWDPITSSASATWERTQELAGASREWIEQRWNDTGDWFNTNVWTPVSEWAAARWRDTETTVSAAHDWTVEKWQGAAGWFQSNVWQPISDRAAEAWSAIKEKTDSTGTEASALWMQVSNYISERFESIRSSAETVWQAVQDVGQTAADLVGSAFSAAWESITGIWQSAGEWFSGTVFGSIVDGAVGAVNDIIGFFSDMASSVADTINSIGGWLSDLAASAGELFSGMTSFNFHIPFLAEGAVIPPNRKFAAVLGDQRSGMNIEAPEKLLRKIVRQEAAPISGLRSSAGDTISRAMSDNGSNGILLSALDDILDAIMAGHDIVLDDASLGRTVRRVMRDQDRIAGAVRV